LCKRFCGGANGWADGCGWIFRTGRVRLLLLLLLYYVIIFYYTAAVNNKWAPCTRAGLLQLAGTYILLFYILYIYIYNNNTWVSPEVVDFRGARAKCMSSAFFHSLRRHGRRRRRRLTVSTSPPKYLRNDEMASSSTVADTFCITLLYSI